MVRVEIRYLVDVAMLIAFIVCAVTGFVLWYALPSGVGGGQSRVFLGVTRLDWVTVHDYSSLLLTVATGIHAVINFKWMVQVTRKILRRT